MRLKRGVRVRGVSPEILLAIMVAEAAYHEAGHEFTITSLTDGRHMIGSYHHTGEAVDLRLPELGAVELRDTIAGRLGPDFDVILESDHIHIEHDPA